jgi:hypothetical protein
MSQLIETVNDQPFGSTAEALWNLGLAVIPLPADDGKSPKGTVRFKDWVSPPKRCVLNDLIRRFADANIGVVTGASGVTVVDIDTADADVVAQIQARFGYTPLRIRTPRGLHCWYAHSGETCTHLRAEGIPADIKGRGGMVAVPPSRRPSNGKRYVIESGSWDDLGRLPAIRAGALQAPSRTIPAPTKAVVREGERNHTLFRESLRLAKNFDLPSLQAEMLSRNASFIPPMSPEEVRKTVESAYRYETAGRNFTSSGNTLAGFLAARRRGPDALYLHLVLMTIHAEENKVFPLTPAAMARSRYFPYWGAARVRGARDLLLEIGLLKRIHQGGRAPGDASTFALGRSPAEHPN